MKQFFKEEQQSFSFFFIFSICSHIVLFVFFMGLNKFWFSFKKDEIVPASIRVDVVGLPDLPAKKEVVEVKKEQPVLIPTKNPVKKNPPKKKDLERKEEKKKQPVQNVEKKKELQKEKEETKTQDEKKETVDSEKKINRGNQLSEGAEEGKEILSSQEMAEINVYFAVISEQIRANWDLPRYLIDMDLIAQIEIKVNEKGKMTYKQITLSSGNDLFDSQVLKAMENASPYPPPPDSVRHFIKDGIVFSMSSRN